MKRRKASRIAIYGGIFVILAGAVIARSNGDQHDDQHGQIPRLLSGEEAAGLAARPEEV